MVLTHSSVQWFIAVLFSFEAQPAVFQVELSWIEPHKQDIASTIPQPSQLTHVNCVFQAIRRASSTQHTKNAATAYLQDPTLICGGNPFHPSLKTSDLVTQIILENSESGAQLPNSLMGKFEGS